MNPGQKAVIKYSAYIDLTNVDLRSITENDEKNGGNVYIGAKNTVTVNNDGTTSTAFSTKGSIRATSINPKEGAVESQDGYAKITDGNATITWTIRVNFERYRSISGLPIKDTLGPGQTLSGVGITVYKTPYGKDAKTTSESVKWTDSRITDYNETKGFTFTPTESDNTPYYYKITYTTTKDESNVTNTTETVTNKVEYPYGERNCEVSFKPGPGDKIVSKTVDASDIDLAKKTVTWHIAVNVPKNGFNKLVVTDTYPSANNNGVNYVEGLSGSDAEAIKVEGLDQNKGEHYELTKKDDKFLLTFYKNAGTKAPGLNGTGVNRTVNITVVTALSNDWLNWSANTNDTDSLLHINKVTADTGDNHISTDQAEAIISPARKSYKELVDETNSQITDSVGNKYPYFKYTVMVAPVNSNSITITDTMPSDFVILDSDWKYASSNTLPSDSMTFQGVKDINNPDQPTAIANYNITKNKLESVDNTKYDITISNIPDAARNYAYCYLTYYIIPKDGTALKNIDQSLKNDDDNNSGYYEFVNTASNSKCADIESQAKTQYVNKDTILKKDLTKADFTNTAYGDYVADYTVEINSKERKLAGDAGKFDVTDKVEKDYLTFDISSLSFKEGDKASTNINSCSILYSDKDGRPIGFTANVNDKKHITVTYRVKIDMKKFSANAKIDLKNTVSNSLGFTVTSEEASARPESLAYSDNPGIYIVKTDSFDASKRLKEATFALLDKDKNPVIDNNKKPVTITTKDGVGTVMGDEDKLGWVLNKDTQYYLKELTPPVGYTKNDTLIPFKITANDNADHICSSIYDQDNVYKNGFMINVPNDKEEKQPEKGSLALQKKIEGITAEEDIKTVLSGITFTVTDHDGNPAKDVNGKDVSSIAGSILNAANNYTYTLADLPTGTYKVKETIDKDKIQEGYSYLITKVNNVESDDLTAELTVTDGGTAVVTFTNGYEKKEPPKPPETGSLVITKTLSGGLPDEDAKKVIEFTVTDPDGKQTKYTLDKDFDYDEGTKQYQMTLNDISVGEYKVEETAYTVDGYDAEVTYSLNSGDSVKGSAVNTTVTNGNTYTVAFTDTYTKQPKIPSIPPTPNKPPMPNTPSVPKVPSLPPTPKIPMNPVDNGEDLPNAAPENKTKSPKTGERNFFFINWFIHDVL